MLPEKIPAAETIKIGKPDVLVPPAVALRALYAFPVAIYPEVVGEPPVPICIRSDDVPLKETPLHTKVARLTPAGIPVKSIEVPDVVATAVPRVIAVLVVDGTNVVAVVITVPVSSGNVSTRSTLLLGLATVKTPVPEALPVIATLLIKPPVALLP
jgi:hypothetical protein